MKLARTMLMAVAVLAVSAFVYANEPNQSGYREIRTVEFISESDAFTIGYKNGYNHGQIDSKTGLDFNFRRNPNFNSGMTYFTYRSAEFRDGYKKGYEEGFGQQPTKIKVVEIQPEEKTTRTIKIVKPAQQTTRTIRVIEPAEKTTTVKVVTAKPSNNGFVRVFTDTEFDGDEQVLSVGRYPYLEDWKNEIESIQIAGDVRVILFDQNNFEGQSVVLDHDTVDLADFDFERRAASMMVVNAMQ